MEKVERDSIVYTVGHSTRKMDELIKLLKNSGIDLLVDIRAIPYSRYNPQFNKETIENGLSAEKLEYVHDERLGGFRPTKEVMKKAKSCSERSARFDKYMETPQFEEGIKDLIEKSQNRKVAIMCGEKDPTHCHRFLVAAKLESQQIKVIHLIDINNAFEHPKDLFTYG